MKKTSYFAYKQLHISYILSKNVSYWKQLHLISSLESIIVKT